MKPAAREALRALLGDAVRFDVPMRRFTSLRVGGPADALATPPDRAAVSATLRLCAEHDLPVHPIGAGFNLLVRDGGIAGVVIRLKKLRALERADDRHLRVEAGVSHASLTRYCIDHGLAGLEFGAGIPGSVGGWLAMNAGIGTREVKDVVRSVAVCGPDGLERELEAARLRFEYRALRGLPAGGLIVAALLEVTPSSREAVRAEVDRHLAQRQGSQPLNVPSCGSVFKNPPGDFAGRLIEATGLKGLRVGGAEVSPVHANFIANVGGATAGDVLALIERIRREVAAAHGVELEPEVRIVGREEAAGGTADRRPEETRR